MPHNKFHISFFSGKCRWMDKCTANNKRWQYGKSTLLLIIILAKTYFYFYFIFLHLIKVMHFSKLDEIDYKWCIWFNISKRAFSLQDPLGECWGVWQAYLRGFQSNTDLEKAKNPTLIGTSFRFSTFDQILKLFFLNYYHNFFSFSILPLIIPKLPSHSLKSPKNLIFFNKNKK